MFHKDLTFENLSNTFQVIKNGLTELTFVEGILPRERKQTLVTLLDFNVSDLLNDIDRTLKELSEQATVHTKTHFDQTMEEVQQLADISEDVSNGVANGLKRIKDRLQIARKELDQNAPLFHIPDNFPDSCWRNALFNLSVKLLEIWLAAVTLRTSPQNVTKEECDKFLKQLEDVSLAIHLEKTTRKDYEQAYLPKEISQNDNSETRESKGSSEEVVVQRFPTHRLVDRTPVNKPTFAQKALAGLKGAGTWVKNNWKSIAKWSLIGAGIAALCATGVGVLGGISVAAIFAGIGYGSMGVGIGITLGGGAIFGGPLLYNLNKLAVSFLEDSDSEESLLVKSTSASKISSSSEKMPLSPSFKSHQRLLLSVSSLPKLPSSSLPASESPTPVSSPRRSAPILIPSPSRTRGGFALVSSFVDPDELSTSTIPCSLSPSPRTSQMGHFSGTRSERSSISSGVEAFPANNMIVAKL